MKTVFVIDASDNVATVVVEPVQRGDRVRTNGRITDRQLAALDDIAYGHKIALEAITSGDTVRKYGLSIGRATQDIQAGQHVHTHNVESERGRGDLASSTAKGNHA